MTELVPDGLHPAIEDSQRLLQYASQKGLALKPELVADIVNARGLLAKDENDPETFDAQKKFWVSLATLSAAVAPASMASIRFNETTVSPWWWRLWAWVTRAPMQPLLVADAAVRRAGCIALAWLVVVCACQAYVEIAATTLKTYADNQTTYERNTKLLQQAEDDNKPLDVNVQIETNRAHEQTLRQLLIMECVYFWHTFPGKLDSEEHARSVLSTTELVLIVLRGFLLPAVWGIIGAALYVLRTLAQDLETMSYSREHASLHRSRYYLGAVAGFVVAKFSLALSGKVLDDAVQPFVLALLVGFSVDLLFNLLTKIIDAFSPKGSANAST